MKKLGTILGIVIVLLILGSMFTYTVREDEVAIVKQLGVIKSAIITPGDEDVIKDNLAERSGIKISADKGLHFKIPFIQKVSKYPSNYLTYLSEEETVNTKDSREIKIQMYAQYRVVDPVQFALSVRSKSEINNKIDSRIYTAIVQSCNTIQFNEFFEGDKITKVLNEKKKSLNEALIEEFGIYAVDIGIHRKNFPQKNLASIEQKMSKQIEKDSEKLIAEGDAEYNKKTAVTDKIKKEIIAEATIESATIKADADAEAMKIYQDSLSKDIEFYKFMRRMEIYKDIKNNTVFLDKDNEFLKDLNGY